MRLSNPIGRTTTVNPIRPVIITGKMLLVRAVNAFEMDSLGFRL